MATTIHPTALVDSHAHIGAEVEIGPYAVIDGGVTLRRGVKVLAHAIITGQTDVGEETEIHMGAILGHLPQDVAFDPSLSSSVRIGRKNVFREYTTVHRSKQPGGVTEIGDEHNFMAFSHIAHDGRIGSNVIVANNALLAGHVEVEDRAFISGNSVIHQFCRIGRLSMISGLTRIGMDVPPFMIAEGGNEITSMNLVGIRRAGFTLEEREKIKWAYKVLYRMGNSHGKALEILEQDSHPIAREFVAFMRKSKRGICSHSETLRARRPAALPKEVAG